MTSYKGSWFGGPKSHCENNDLLQGLWVCACQKWPLKITRARAVTTPWTPRSWRTGARGPRRSGHAADETLPREWGPRGLGQGLPGRRIRKEPGEVHDEELQRIDLAVVDSARRNSVEIPGLWGGRG